MSSSGFAELDTSFWALACKANADGIGLMYHDSKALVVRYADTPDISGLEALLTSVPPGLRAAVHLREATAGARGRANLHPRLTQLREGRLAIMHNGCLRKVPAHPTQGPSDTAIFASKLLPNLLERGGGPWHDPRNLTAVRQFAGTRNRFVLLDERGQWRVVAEDEGFWVGQTWLSHPRAKNWLTPSQPPQLTIF